MTKFTNSTFSPLAIEGGEPTLAPGEGIFEWPIIDTQAEESVIKQLRASVSIYDRSGVFERFERKFSIYHSRIHALLVNSGTSALFSSFEGIGLQSGDEIICPAYTFFATASPLVQFGVSIVFADIDASGNIAANAIENLITAKTKAIVVTHMWGIPCDMPEIMDIAQRRRLLVIEDCSHAHGALVAGQVVGSFGDVAAWSLQGQKIVTGGEGGILTTNNSEIFYRALSHGHYNKRCKAEIPKEHHLSAFATTGLGLKLRAHPLAIALAEDQLARLDEWLQIKRKFSKIISHELKNIPFISLPIFHEKEPSWYAYTLKYNKKLANDVALSDFVRALHHEGLTEVDIPNSTTPIYNLPLFNRTHEILPRIYKKPARINMLDSFPMSELFYSSIFKIPVWARESDLQTVNAYIHGLKKVCQAVIEKPLIFNAR